MNLSRLLQTVTRPFTPPSRIGTVYRTLTPNACVLDVGCAGFVQARLAQAMGRTNLRHFGIDYCDRNAELPSGYGFKRVDLNREAIPFEAGSFDLVVASHILEHVVEPLRIFSECVRVCKPGGIIYIAAPSERSLFSPGMFFKYDRFLSLSFFDDPTHLGRPWTPQSLYRMARYFGCEPENVGYSFSWTCRVAAPLLLGYALLTRKAELFQRVWWYSIGWESYGVIRTPLCTADTQFTYYFPAGIPACTTPQ